MGRIREENARRKGRTPVLSLLVLEVGLVYTQCVMVSGVHS